MAAAAEKVRVVGRSLRQKRIMAWPEGSLGGVFRAMGYEVVSTSWEERMGQGGREVTVVTIVLDDLPEEGKRWS